MNSKISNLDIIVHSYTDLPLNSNTDIKNNRSNFFGAMVRTYKNHNKVINDYKIKPLMLEDQNSSGYEQELKLILQEILDNFEHLEQNSKVKIICKERQIPKIIKRLKNCIIYVSSKTGKREFEINSLNDFVIDLVYDQNIFNPKIQTLPILLDFLHSFVCLIDKKENAQSISFDCRVYKPKDTDEEHPTNHKFYDVATETKNYVLAYGNRMLNLTEEDISEQVINRKYY